LAKILALIADYQESIDAPEHKRFETHFNAYCSDFPGAEIKRVATLPGWKIIDNDAATGGAQEQESSG
jgi:hypothetical protein